MPKNSNNLTDKKAPTHEEILQIAKEIMDKYEEVFRKLAESEKED